MAERLSDDSVEARLLQLDSWSLVDGKLHREFKFANFIEAFGFMTSSALEAEKLDHHPEWSNVYNKVVVDLTTHEAGGITELDFKLAARMDEIATAISG